MGKRISMPIDNKNILEDWIYEDVFRDGWMETPDNKKSIRDIIGFYEGYLLNAHWCFGSNRVSFSFVDLPCRHVRHEVEEKFMEYLNIPNEENDATPFVTCGVWKSGVWIICDFYYEGDE